MTGVSPRGHEGGLEPLASGAGHVPMFQGGDCSSGRGPASCPAPPGTCAELTPRWVGVKAGAPWVWETAAPTWWGAPIPCLSSILSMAPSHGSFPKDAQVHRVGEARRGE